MRVISMLFWGGISVIVFLIVGVFLIRIVRRYGGPVSSVASAVASAAGIAA